MKSALGFVFAITAAFTPLRVATAQHEHQHETTAQLGHVSFPTTCAPALQSRFEQAVALLHSFWYEEATRAFDDVIAADSTCALAYWGRAMTFLHPLWTPPTKADNEAGLAAAEHAVRLAREGTREYGYASAIATFYRRYDALPFNQRLLAYESAMKDVTEQYPTDTEAQIFYALALISNGQLDSKDTTFARQQRAGEILEPLYAKDPQHPGLAHYLIHAYDSPRFADRAIKAAGHYADIAPDVPHARHMPSHIYTRVGDWDKSIASNLSSAAAAREFELAQKTTAMWDQRAHALDYLEYAYLQQGRDARAAAIADTIAQVSAGFPDNSLINDYAWAAIPARYALEREQWAIAASLPVHGAPGWRGSEAITYFARALGSARSGHAPAAKAAIDSLSVLESALAQMGGPQTYWSTQARIERLAASAWVTLAERDTATALRLAKEAADLEDVTEKHPVTPGAVLPARELEGDLLLIVRQPAAALAAYESSLARQPNRGRSLYGAATAARMAGNMDLARKRYQAYATLMSKADGSRPELAEVRRILARR